VVNETKAGPPVPFHILFPSPKPLVNTAIDLPDVGTEKAEAIKNPASKRAKANPTANAKGKKNTRLISRMARNKPKPSAESKPIILSEDSDSDVEHFLASEYPLSQGLCHEPPYDFCDESSPLPKE
jgi:hypothetical protein